MNMSGDLWDSNVTLSHTSEWLQTHALHRGASHRQTYQQQTLFECKVFLFQYKIYYFISRISLQQSVQRVPH